jgi:hypothetical protein
MVHKLDTISIGKKMDKSIIQYLPVPQIKCRKYNHSRVRAKALGQATRANKHILLRCTSAQVGKAKGWISFSNKSTWRWLDTRHNINNAVPLYWVYRCFVGRVDFRKSGLGNIAVVLVQ